MDKQPIHGSSRFKRFITGRGFYAVLAACLLAIGGVAVATFGETLFVSEKGEQQPSEPLQPVEQVVSGQPDERKTTTSTTTTTSTVTTTTTAPPAAADLYVLPMGNLVQKAFSAGALSYSDTMKDWRVHDGADFAGEEGQAVKAVADGQVTEVREDPLWGEVLTLDHGMDVLSYYYGVHADVTEGQKVSVGQVIGTLVTIPCEQLQGAHLHLEMQIDGELVDPVTAIGREVRYAQPKNTDE